MKRSTIPFARGARTGVRMMRMSAPANNGVEAGRELGISVTDQESELLGAVTEVHQQVAGLLGDPSPAGVSGDPREVDAAAAVLDHDEHVQAAEQDLLLFQPRRRHPYEQ